jgi:hypothetical protein
MNQRQAALPVLAALLVVSCDGAKGSGPTSPEIQQGQGPCGQGINVSIEDKQYFVPLTLLPRTSVVVDGVQQEAIALTELLPSSVLEPYSFEGKFTTAQLRLLYDCRLAGEQTGTAEITITPESMETGYLLTAGRSVYLKDAATSGPAVQGICRVDALRRMLVTRKGITKGVHIAGLPTEPYLEQGTQTDAVSFKDVILSSGLLAQSEPLTQFDYRLVPVDFLDKRDKAIRFPWGHGHLAKLRWIPSAARTRSLDTTGDLKTPSGVVAHQGVASSGWSSIKLLLEVELEPAPDPSHTVNGPGGPLTDPATCDGCHKTGSGVVIPVSCVQCHSR